MSIVGDATAEVVVGAAEGGVTSEVAVLDGATGVTGAGLKVLALPPSEEPQPQSIDPSAEAPVLTELPKMTAQLTPAAARIIRLTLLGTLMGMKIELSFTVYVLSTLSFQPYLFSKKRA